MNARSTEDDVPIENLSPHLEFPTPPSFSPQPIHDGKSASCPIFGASGTCTRNLASSNVSHLPSLSRGEETLLWPLKETFGLLGGQFQDGTHYVLNEELGSGCSGFCYRATTISGSLTFCVKMCDHVKEEILALTLAKKDNVKYIVDYYGTKLEGGTLEKHIERQREKLPVGAWPIIDEGTCFDFVGDILKGVEFLNSKGLVHGDIKGDNVLLDESCTHVKLADFGLSRKIKDYVGTPDVLRTGRLLIEMLNGGRSSILDRFLFGNADYRRLKTVFQKHFPPQASEETTDLLNIIFASEQLVRAADILRISRQLQPLQK